MTQPEANQLRERALTLLLIERDQVEEQMALRDFDPEATLNQRRKPVIKFQNPDRLDNLPRGFEFTSAPPSSVDRAGQSKD